MSKGPKPVAKTTSSNRWLSGVIVMPITCGIICFLPPHVDVTHPAGPGLFIDKIGFLMNAAPLCGVLLFVGTFLGIDQGAKILGGGMKIGDTTELSDYEGK